MVTKIQAIRRAMGLQQKELAKKLSIDTALVCRVERRQMIAYPKLRRRLSESLGVNEQELFDSQGFARLVS